MVRPDARICAAVLALTLIEAAGSSVAFAQQAAGGGGGTTGAALDYATARLERRLMAARAAGPITLDGVLDEPSWNDAPVASHFLQNDPREGQPATFDTDVRVLYDDGALYFGVFARDDDP